MERPADATSHTIRLGSGRPFPHSTGAKLGGGPIQTVDPSQVARSPAMTTILLSGVGALGGWALELLARSPGVDRIVTVKRSPWPGVALPTLASIGAVFQGHTKRFEHHQIDLNDVSALARLLAEVKPDVVLHSATVRSPRRLMNATVDPGIRSVLSQATFGMWLPWHLLPAARLTEAVAGSGIETKVVNASFPDVVNPAIWAHHGHGPVAGAGNVEVCAAQVLRYLVDVDGNDPADVEVSLVGSHALLGYGPTAGVPYHLQVLVGGRDVTGVYSLDAMLEWPEPIQWSKVDVFSLFAASAVKNALALVAAEPVRTHVTGPNGLPGGYPALVEEGEVVLDLPDGLSSDAAVDINRRAARWDGIDHIDSDGTVVYTDLARGAMAELGYHEDSVRFGDLALQADRLSDLYERLTTLEGNYA